MHKRKKENFMIKVFENEEANLQAFIGMKRMEAVN
jgi:hypothetical protein